MNEESGTRSYLQVGRTLRLGRFGTTLSIYVSFNAIGVNDSLKAAYEKDTDNTLLIFIARTPTCF